MVAPFKPYSRLIERRRVERTDDGRLMSVGHYYFASSGKSQKAPYVNTAYHCDIQEYLYGRFTAVNGWAVDPFSEGDAKVVATNKARAKFVSSLGDTSQLGSTLTAERKATYGTVVTGTATLLRSVNQLRKGQLAKAAHTLGASPPEKRVTLVTRNRKGRKRRVTVTRLTLPTGRTVVKTAANGWLWWSYAIQPLVGDLYNALDVLQRQCPWTRVEGYGRGDYVFTAAGIAKRTYVCRVTISANVRVKNPNLFLLNQLGLVNPVQMINEGIPFSFVVDWFSNLSQVISQITDFVGLEIADPMTATKASVVAETTAPYEGKKRTFKTRTLSIPSAKLKFKYERFNWQRGANAISLLVGFLPKK